MDQVSVKDIMVPLSAYATVDEDATLYEAVAALTKSQREFDPGKDRHRAVLIKSKAGKVVGKLSQLDVLRALEPRYNRVIDEKSSFLMGVGMSPELIMYIKDQFSLWDKPLSNICDKAGSIKVNEVMHTPTPGEFVTADARLNEAIHLLVMGRHQSLLVLEHDNIIGVLRLTDVYQRVQEIIVIEAAGGPK